MTDAPPPSIPPSIPPRKRPTPGARARTVTVPGRGGPRTDDAPRNDAAHVGTTTSRADEAQERTGRAPSAGQVRAEQGRAEQARSAPERRVEQERPTTPPPPVAEASSDDDLPSPLAVAVGQTGHWLKKAADATGTSMSAAYASLTRPRPKDDPMTANPEARSAPRTIPPTAPATTGPSPSIRPVPGRTQAVGSGPRRVRLAISRVDPWSVMKLAFLLSFAAGIVLVVAVSVLWLTLDGLHVFTSINSLVTQIVGQESSIDILDYMQFSKVLSVSTLIAVIDVFLLTALSTIGAFLYNVVAALVGGIHVSMTDE